ncbi:MAG: hypothetical protein WD069_07960 [Planctomycetales bacterium]
MAKRLVFPIAASADVLALVRLTPQQLRQLVELFSTADSAHPLRAEFINSIAETLRLPVSDARSVVAVLHCLLIPRDDSQHPDPAYARDLIDDLREFVDQQAPDDVKAALLTSLDTNRTLFESLATPKPLRVRALKVRRLASGPEPMLDSVRTLCQLRPLFEGEAHNEDIAGVVPSILLQFETTDQDGDAKTFAFGLTPSGLDELSATIERTKEKLEAIRNKYGPDLLT